MTAMTDPQLVTAAEVARLLGVTRQRVLELATSTADFPAPEPTASGGRVWPRVAVQAWAAAHPDPGPIFAGPDLPPDGGRPPQVWRVVNHAADEAHQRNHPWSGEDHLVLGMLHPGGRRTDRGRGHRRPQGRGPPSQRRRPVRWAHPLRQPGRQAAH